MGKFFNSEDLPVRAGSHSVKWDGMAAKYGRGDLQPLWVDVMIVNTTEKKVCHGRE